MLIWERGTYEMVYLFHSNLDSSLPLISAYSSSLMICSMFYELIKVLLLQLGCESRNCPLKANCSPILPIRAQVLVKNLLPPTPEGLRYSTLKLSPYFNF